MNFEIARELMIHNQLKPNNIFNENILDLFNNIDKEVFLPDQKKEMAYIDNYIYLSEKRYYLTNLQIAQLIQSADIYLNNKVLHIGGLTGYVSLILSKLCSHLFVVEEDINFFKILKDNIKKFKISNITLINNANENGYLKEKPYDVIFIDSVIEKISDHLLNQLQNDNGKFITIKKITNNLAKGIKITKSKKSFYEETIFDSLNQLPSIFKKNIKFKL